MTDTVDPQIAGTRGVLDRRHALKVMAGAGLVALAACGSSSDEAGRSTTSTAAEGGAADASTTTSRDGAAAASCETIPPETGGPFPGDGSNGPNILDQDGVVRRDITKSIGSSSGTAAGVPLRIELTILDSDGCTPLAGAAVYLWHCDRDGDYSMYGQASGENYLRGVQAADADGTLSFDSIFPAAYSGRWPHIHFEVYKDVAAATGGGQVLATSQLALPQDVCERVYATAGYEQSVRNLAQTSLERDNVFSDGHDQQLATVTGTVSDGLVANLSVAV